MIFNDLFGAAGGLVASGADAYLLHINKQPVFIFVRRKKDEDSIQLWRRIAKTEYSDPPDTGYLSFCGQLSD